MKRILAALLALTLLFSLSACTPVQTPPASDKPAESGKSQDDPSLIHTGTFRKAAEAARPVMAPYPNEEEYLNDGDYEAYEAAFDAWRDSRDALRGDAAKELPAMAAYLKATLPLMLDGKGENRVYSPVNVYMALAMLAEITDGTSRQQVLDLMGADSIEQARRGANAIWRTGYTDDGQVTSLLGASLWLREDVKFRQQTLDTLADQYYASSYYGDTACEEMTKALQDWINEQTGGLLKEQASNEKLERDTVLALVTTIYYKAGWQDKFMEMLNTTGPFHADSGDIDCTFMHTDQNVCFYGDKFTAVIKGLAEGASMSLILPDEGVTPEQLLEDEETLSFLMQGYRWEKQKYMTVHLSVPKFDVASRTDLMPVLNELGVTDVMSGQTADFSPLTEEDRELALSAANHAARVKIDEEGVEAAAYTVMLVADGAFLEMDEMDLVLDRPFLFAITSADGLPLFTGVVHTPAE